MEFLTVGIYDKKSLITLTTGKYKLLLRLFRAQQRETKIVTVNIERLEPRHRLQQPLDALLGDRREGERQGLDLADVRVAGNGAHRMNATIGDDTLTFRLLKGQERRKSQHYYNGMKLGCIRC